MLCQQIKKLALQGMLAGVMSSQPSPSSLHGLYRSSHTMLHSCAMLQKAMASQSEMTGAALQKDWTTEGKLTLTSDSS